MNFGQAFEAMRDGNKVRLPDWQILNGSISLSDGCFPIIYESDHESTRVYRSYKNAIDSLDWEVIKDIPEVKVTIKTIHWFTCPKCSKDNKIGSMKLDVHCGICGYKVKLVYPEKCLKYYNVQEEKTEENISIETINLRNKLRLLNFERMCNYINSINTVTPSEIEKFIEENSKFLQNLTQLDKISLDNFRVSFPSLRIDKNLKSGEAYFISGSVFTYDKEPKKEHKPLHTYEIRYKGTWVCNIRCTELEETESNIPYSFKDKEGFSIAWAPGHITVDKLSP